MKVAALSGGTGSAKLLRGLSKLSIDLTVIANVADNIWMYGVYVCPDIDISCYTLAGIVNRSSGWGINGDTFDTLSSLSRYGFETWFRLGDRDFATCLARTEMIRNGATLTFATDKIRRAMGVKAPILPVTDTHVETRIETERGVMHLQEFWVKDRGKPSVKGLAYKGTRGARVTEKVAKALASADRILVCPANPVTSIGPMLAVPGFARLLSRSKGRISALSPMEGRYPFSGPALKLMKATGIRGDSVGVATLYSKFLDEIIISKQDDAMKKEIESLGIRCVPSSTRMNSEADEVRLARELIQN